MSNSRTQWYWRHPRTALVLFNLVVILLLDLTVGTVLHALGVRLPDERLDRDYRGSHPVYHHGLQPGRATRRAQWGAYIYPLNTDNFGFASAEVRDTPLKSENPRLLLMGDSFTEGIGMAYGDTFAGMLSQSLSGQRIEVLNASAASYSPIIYLRKMEHLLEQGLEVDMVMVFIDISDIFDEATAYRFDENRNVIDGPDQPEEERERDFSDTLKDLVKHNTVLMGWTRNRIRLIRHSLVDPASRLDGSLNRSKCRWVFKDEAWQQYGKQGLELATEHMDALHRLLRDHGITMNVVVYPWPDQVQRLKLEDRQVRHWREWCRARDVGFLDCYPAFIKEGMDTKSALLRYYIPGDVHWTREGHAVIAQEVEEHLSSIGGVPPRKTGQRE